MSSKQLQYHHSSEHSKHVTTATGSYPRQVKKCTILLNYLICKTKLSNLVTFIVFVTSLQIVLGKTWKKKKRPCVTNNILDQNRN